MEDRHFLESRWDQWCHHASAYRTALRTQGMSHTNFGERDRGADSWTSHAHPGQVAAVPEPTITVNPVVRQRESVQTRALG